MGRISVFLILVQIVFYGSVTGKNTDETNKAKGLIFYQSGNYDKAIEFLEKAYKENIADVSVIQFLGDIYYELDDEDKATYWMERALDVQEGNLPAQFVLAKIYREKGWHSSFPIRALQWKKSERYFKGVMSTDSTYRSVLYEYALLKKYKEDYSAAIHLLYKQLAQNPNDIKAEHQLDICFDELLAFAGKDEIERHFNTDTTVTAEHYFGEYLRLQKKFSQADSVFQDLLTNRQISVVPVYYALSRLRYQQQDYDAAMDFYTQAIDSIFNEAEADFMFHDIKYIVADIELDFYKHIDNIGQIKNFFQKTWLRRNPLPALKYNSRILEHIRRMLYAEKYYRFNGLRTVANDPDMFRNDAVIKYPRVFFENEKFNDKGLVYIRYGAPDETTSGIYSMPRKVGNAAFDGKTSHESWYYYATNLFPKLFFHFRTSETGQPDAWRLTSHLDYQLLEDCYHWDSHYDQLFAASSGFEYQKRVGFALKNDKNSWGTEEKIPLSVPYYLAVFKGKKKTNRIELYYGLTARDIWKNNKADSDDSIKVGFSAYDKNWIELYRSSKIVSAAEITTASDSFGIWPDQFSFELQEESCFINFYAILDNKLGGHKFKWQGEPWDDNRLQMSDLELASNIGTSKKRNEFVKNDLVVPAKT